MTRHGETGTKRPPSAARAHESGGSRLTAVAQRRDAGALGATDSPCALPGGAAAVQNPSTGLSVDTKQWPAWPPWPRRLWHGAVRGAPAVVVIGVTGLGLYLWAPDGDTLRIPAAVGAGTFSLHVMIRLLAPLGR